MDGYGVRTNINPKGFVKKKRWGVNISRFMVPIMLCLSVAFPDAFSIMALKDVRFGYAGFGINLLVDSCNHRRNK